MTKIDKDKIKVFLTQNSDWKVFGSKTIKREFMLDSFKEAIRFVNKVAELAEKMDHHPDILIKYKKVKLTLTTHSAGGLSEKDFSLAKKINKL